MSDLLQCRVGTLKWLYAPLKCVSRFVFEKICPLSGPLLRLSTLVLRICVLYVQVTKFVALGEMHEDTDWNRNFST